MKPKILHIDERIDPAYRDDILRAEEALERVLGEGGPRVEVRWDAASDGADCVARLTLSDSGVSKSHDFYEFEFREARHVRQKLRNLWDEILAERARILQGRIRESLANSGGQE